jgi:hypothetical protein
VTWLRWRIERWRAARTMYRAATAFEKDPDNRHHQALWRAAQHLEQIRLQKP